MSQCNIGIAVSFVLLDMVDQMVATHKWLAHFAVPQSGHLMKVRISWQQCLPGVYQYTEYYLPSIGKYHQSVAVLPRVPHSVNWFAPLSLPSISHSSSLLPPKVASATPHSPHPCPTSLHNSLTTNYCRDSTQARRSPPPTSCRGAPSHGVCISVWFSVNKYCLQVWGGSQERMMTSSSLPQWRRCHHVVLVGV